MSLDDLNFNMENSSSLADVKLLLKRQLGSYWNKLLFKFCITFSRFHARVQSSTCATYEKCNNGRANSEIGYTTDCLYSFWDRQKYLEGPTKQDRSWAYRQKFTVLICEIGIYQTFSFNLWNFSKEHQN